MLPQDGFRSCLYSELSWHMRFHCDRTTSDLLLYSVFVSFVWPEMRSLILDNLFMTLYQQRISSVLVCHELFYPFLLPLLKYSLNKPIRECKLATASLLNSNLYSRK